MASRRHGVGEESISKYGHKMVITEYENKNNVVVHIPEYNYSTKAYYSQFKNRTITTPYDRTKYGIGFIGEGKYKVRINGKLTNEYNTWSNMMARGYDEKYKKKSPTYEDCTVCEEWHNFQNFAKWYEENYYEVENEKMNLDKDILVKRNKKYSPDTCMFVPSTINRVFTKRQNDRGKFLIGVSWDKSCECFKAYCSTLNKREYIGSYNNEFKAFLAYKYFKEKYIKKIAEKYRGAIPERLYIAMYNYEVETED